MKVRTRMAPSPTGEYHVGHIATLLKNYAFARHHGGQFVLRIEDTDQNRKVEGAVDKILEVIRGFNLDWDEGPQKGGPHEPYFQSQRLSMYHEAIEELIKKDKAYYCFATPEELAELREQQRAEKKPPRYDGRYRDYPIKKAKQRIEAGESYVVRLKVPEDQDITFTDLIRGDITFNSSEVDDQVLLKSDGFPTYHLAVVVDDHDMDITHVMRGEEWISSTPKHMLLYQAFEWSSPVYAHIPVFLNPDGKGKMSKRKGTVSAQSFLDAGYLPEALINFFMILGWAHPEEKEILTLDEYIQYFDPKDISPNSVVFDLKKLAWINGQYIRALSIEELLEKLTPYIPEEYSPELVKKVVPLVRERLQKLSDFAELTDFFVHTPEVETSKLLKKSNPETVSTQLELTAQALIDLSSWNNAEIEKAIRELQEKHEWKKGQYFMMLRLASTGQKATPPLFETIEAIGQQEIVTRFSNAQKSL